MQVGILLNEPSKKVKVLFINCVGTRLKASSYFIIISNYPGKIFIEKKFATPSKKGNFLRIATITKPSEFLKASMFLAILNIIL